MVSVLPISSGTIEEDGNRVQDISVEDAHGLIYQKKLPCKLAIEKNHLKLNRVEQP